MTRNTGYAIISIMVKENISEADFDRKASVFPSYAIAFASLGITRDDVDWETPDSQIPFVKKSDLKLEGQNVKDRAKNLLGALDHFSLAAEHKNQPDSVDFHTEQAMKYFRAALGAEAMLSAGYTSEQVDQIVREEKQKLTDTYISSDLQHRSELKVLVDSLLPFARQK